MQSETLLHHFQLPICLKIYFIYTHMHIAYIRLMFYSYAYLFYLCRVSECVAEGVLIQSRTQPWEYVALGAVLPSGALELLTSVP